MQVRAVGWPDDIAVGSSTAARLAGTAPGLETGGMDRQAGAVVGPGVPDVEQTRSDAAIVGGQDSDPTPADGQDTSRPSVAPRAQAGSGKSRRSPLSVIFGVLKRLWIPLVILAVIGVGGLTVTRLHGMFGSEKRLSYADTRTDDTRPGNPQHLRYDIFGPPGTLAGISYFDGDGDLQRIKNIPLPWTFEFEVTAATAGGNIVAQGDSDSIGCRITVDGTVKEEKTTHAASAFIFCRQKADE